MWGKSKGRSDAAANDGHQHDLAVIDVHHPPRVPLAPETTVVLIGCKDCAHVESILLDGRWNLEQVTFLHQRPHDVPEQEGQ